MTPEEYDAKREARYTRLLRAADRAATESASLQKQADSMASIIPFGQPILVGHYSENVDRRYRERIHNKMRKGYDLHLKAQALRNRAESAKRNHAIFSDDPNAAEKIADKIARLEERQKLMVQANKLVRKNDREGLAAMGFSDTLIVKMFIPDFCGRIGFPDYATTNNNANIRRLRKRLGKIEKHSADVSSERVLHGVKIVDDTDSNRLQLFFDGKPASSVRDDLKRSGFHWSPMSGAWQRMRSNGATYAAEYIINKHFGEANP